ncbi:MAG: alpha-1,4-glucan--maltose-1-phosphate maltosyltransferase [Pseudomonadota bacterium]
MQQESLLRVVIEHVCPEIDAGRYAIKRTVGESVWVEADLFADGHEVVAGDVVYRRRGSGAWLRSEMTQLGNDRFGGRFPVPELGEYEYTVEAWVDGFETWRLDLAKRRAADQDVTVDLEIGARILDAAAARAPGYAGRLAAWAANLRAEAAGHPFEAVVDDPALAAVMRAAPPPGTVRRHPRILDVVVERELARFSSWYEFFPRSCGPPGAHGTLADATERLDYVAGLGFNVVYLPPIHPVGRVNRKGPNNDPDGGHLGPGSPWAIGSADGGHRSIEPALGTLEDFHAFVRRAAELGLEVALDIAFQCAPDHPEVARHPDWFRTRPDGTIQYAENPPKRYQDIYPFDFESPGHPALWEALHDVVVYWVEQGVRVFRVDNPHTKPFRFWEWLIGRIKRRHPDTVFLSEAFTRPKVMHHLAKLGFSQSYTYFTWRNGKHELIEYFTELTREPEREYFRPNVWPNTPDILHEYLQEGGRPAFVIRALLATTLSASYGIYGPAFELHENRPLRPGSEEYLDSEKYQLRHWELDREDSLAGLVATLNRIRNAHAALQADWSLEFHRIDNDRILAYSKCHGDQVLLMVVSLDFRHAQSGWVHLPLARLGLPEDAPFVAHDLLTDARYQWQGADNFVMLDPGNQPGHVLRLVDVHRTGYAFPSFL